MNTELQKAKMSNKLSFIMYSPTSPPRYFEIEKHVFRFLLFGLPSIALLCAMTLIIVTAYNIATPPIINSPTSSITTKNKVPTPNNNVTEKLDLIPAPTTSRAIAQTNETAPTDTIIRPDSDSATHAPPTIKYNPAPFAIFKLPSNSKDLTEQKDITLSNINIMRSPQQVKINFNINNVANPKRRINGNIFIMAQIKGQIIFWPSTHSTDDSIKIDFLHGESFSTNYFRPVNAYMAGFHKTNNSTWYCK